MRKEQIYLSTIASDAVRVAKEYGVNLEIAEYCTAWNMDEKFENVDQVVRKKLDGISQSVLHAPFNELFPCAIDKKARELAADRYRQAIELAKRYGSPKSLSIADTIPGSTILSGMSSNPSFSGKNS